MHKTYLLFLLIFQITVAQKSAKDFGYRQVKYTYKNEEVFVIIKSKSNEETIKKPLLFFCQGSLPQPVLKYDEDGLYSVFPFNENTFLDNYHLIIINKPGIPVIADVKDLGNNYCWLTNGKMPAGYAKNNHLDYYTNRNNFIVKKLLNEPWADKKGLVVAGHSEGSTIAAKMAHTNNKVTKLIYSGGNPYGRITSVLAQERYRDKTETTLDYWKHVNEQKDDDSTLEGDTNKATYTFSEPVAGYILKLKIPVLISYGTKDWGAPYNDLLHINTIRDKKANFKFLAYEGLEHNYFPTDDKMNPDYNIYNWDNVGNDWLNWLKQQ